jgi:hypothetical protein
MKSHVNYLLISLWAAVFCPALSSRAATLWTGPATNFVNIAGTDPNQATNQDRLTANVWITRGGSQGLWNKATESGFVHFFSPQGTEWSDGALANYASLTYVDWNTWAKIQHGGPPSTVGVNAVVHLIADDIYLSVTFTSWGAGIGGFTYTRSTPPAANQPPILTIQLTGDTLDISWPNAGGRLQSKTNILSASWVDVPNSTTTNRVIVPLSPGSDGVFYRLAPQ